MTTFPTRTAFREWLAAKPADEVVACHWSNCDCPLAKYTGYNIDPSYDNGMFYNANEPSIENTLPDWANEFANEVDYHNDGNTPITAAQCLAILDAIP